MLWSSCVELDMGSPYPELQWELRSATNYALRMMKVMAQALGHIKAVFSQADGATRPSAGY